MAGGVDGVKRTMAWAALAALLLAGGGVQAGRGLTPKQAAARFPTAEQCANAATLLLKDEADKAWFLMKGCMFRRDFADLDLLLKEPWLGRLRKDKDALRGILAVLHARTDTVADLKRLKDAGVQVYNSQDVLMRGSVQAKRAPFIFLATVTSAQTEEQPDGDEAFVVIFDEIEYLTPAQLRERANTNSSAYVQVKDWWRNNEARSAAESLNSSRYKLYKMANEASGKEKYNYSRRTWETAERIEYPTGVVVETTFQKPVGYFVPDATYLVLGEVVRVDKDATEPKVVAKVIKALRRGVAEPDEE